MTLAEELARAVPEHRRRWPREDAPKEIVPVSVAAPEDPSDAARKRLRAEIPPPDDD